MLLNATIPEYPSVFLFQAHFRNMGKHLIKLGLALSNELFTRLPGVFVDKWSSSDTFAHLFVKLVRLASSGLGRQKSSLPFGDALREIVK